MSSLVCAFPDGARFLEWVGNIGGERGIRTPPQGPDSLGRTGEHTEKDTGIAVVLGHDLSRVVTAWSNLPEALKAAILAIVNTVADKAEDHR